MSDTSIEATRQAVFRFITKAGADVTDVASSYCDIEGYTPDTASLRDDLDRLVELGELRVEGERYFDTEIDRWEEL